jgi:SAM-dependent methyltransferase
MGIEKDLLINYPRTERSVFGRSRTKTDEDRQIARQFGKEFFDGSRRHGYGGYTYDPKYWSGVVPMIVEEYKLMPGSRILDIGCAKGFMLKDFLIFQPGLIVSGIDISEYAVANTELEVKEFVRVGNAHSLPYEDNSFDLVISINSVHNLAVEECKEALTEIERVSRGESFITVDAYETQEEKERMDAWNLTALTILRKSEWIDVFNSTGFSGDYYWFIP